MSITIKDNIPGCGAQWTMQPILDRWEWLGEHFQKDEYKLWYGSLTSDDMYIQFFDDQHALAYKLRWMVK